MPRPGFAAGPCLVKDTMQLSAFARNQFGLGHAALLINEGLVLHVIDDIKRRYDLAQTAVGLLGMAFKAESDDMRASLSYKFKNALSGLARAVLTTDPFVTTDPELKPLDEVIAKSDILVLCAPHACLPRRRLQGQAGVRRLGPSGRRKRHPMTAASPLNLDIVIPVYNEGANILPTLAALARAVKTPLRVLICYDQRRRRHAAGDHNNRAALSGLAIEFVRNRGRGAHAAVLTGFASSTAPFVLVYPADDDYNAGMLDAMVGMAQGGCDIVCASRFMAGRQHGGLPLAEGGAGAHRQFHALSSRPAADARCQQRLPPVLAPRDGRDRGRIRPRLLLQHRAPGEMPPARLARSARCRCAGSSARTGRAGSR